MMKSIQFSMATQVRIGILIDSSYKTRPISTSLSIVTIMV